MTDYERGQQDLAQEIYNIIFNQENYGWQLIYRADKETARHFSDILMKIYDLLKDKTKSIRGLRAKLPMIDDYCEVPPDLVTKLTNQEKENV